MKPFALLLIDIQNGMDELDYFGGRRNNVNAESNMTKILEHWRRNNWPLYHVKHNSTSKDSPLRPGQGGNDIKGSVRPINDEPVIEKSVNSAFIGTDLLERVQNDKIEKLTIIGLTTEHCVSTTTRMAGNYGLEVVLVSDATAAFDRKVKDGSVISAEDVHRTELALLDGEFCTVMTTKEILNE